MPLPSQSRWPKRNAQGFTYLALLFFIAFIGAGLSSIGVIWYTAQKAEKEKELLIIGHEFRNAIKGYYFGISGISMYPASLEDLLKDPRQIAPRRYLRKVYADPVTGKPEWGLIKTPEGRIMGVYSLSQDSPQKVANFQDKDKVFVGAKTYRDWKFVFEPNGIGERRY